MPAGGSREARKSLKTQEQHAPACDGADARNRTVLRGVSGTFRVPAPGGEGRCTHQAPATLAQVTGDSVVLHLATVTGVAASVRLSSEALAELVLATMQGRRSGGSATSEEVDQ